MALHLAPWLKNLPLVDNEGEVRPLRLDEPFAWAQKELCTEIERQYNQGKPVRIIVLKARQLGISTVTAGVSFVWVFLHENTNGLIVAHENDTAMSLFEKTQYFWEHAPWRALFDAKHATQRRFRWSNGSGIHIATAGNLTAGVGRTIQVLHTSEAALYPDPEKLMVGLRQAMPSKHGTIEVVESTARGIGNWFHEQWQAATSGRSDYVPLFFPWYRHYEYQMPTRLHNRLELDEEERRLHDLGAPYEAIQWRRVTLPNKCNGDEDYFRQEYPATPEEAFITSGSSIFNLRALQSVYDPRVPHANGALISETNDGFHPRFVPDYDKRGPLTIYKQPSSDKRGDRYFIAGDPSQAVHGDPACIQVINRGTLEQVAVWHGECDPIQFAREMMLLGWYYHGAMLCPEAEGGGQMTVATLLNAEYPAIWKHRWFDKAPGKVAEVYGFSQNYNRKQAAIGLLQHVVNDGSLLLHDPQTFYQMQNFIRRSTWEMGASSPDVHDDAVMALAIGVIASQSEGVFSEFEEPPGAHTRDLYAIAGGESF